ncbi:hypothetical protein [Terrisporobacter petrolearius]|uniref:hypothetical protein n=1 Tax=Terrisporobacter petrolearius TaxID=1460447 RepID=UPI0031CC72CC
MTVPEVAKFLLLDVSTIYKYLKNGKMDNDKVISMLRYKFNRHYGYDVETKGANLEKKIIEVKSLQCLDYDARGCSS